MYDKTSIKLMIIWYSNWNFILILIDRCLSLYFLTWKQTYGKLSNAKYNIILLTIICLSLNSHILFLNGYRENPSSAGINCYASQKNPRYIYPQWERVHLFSYNLCPFLIMCICNTYIIYITVRSARIRLPKAKQFPQHRQLSIMLISITFAFVLLTLPSCIYYVFFRHRMSQSTAPRMFRYMVQICLGSVQFTAHAINFFLYCFTTKKFRNELSDFIKEVLFCFVKPSISTTFNNVISKDANKNHSTRKRYINQEVTIERQHTGQNYVLKDMQTILINNS